MKPKGKAGASGRRERRVFNAEFKAAAVRLMTDRRAVGVSLADVGCELEVRLDQLRIWAKELRGEPGAPAPTETADQELRRLRRENAVLRQEQAFATKVAVYFAKESR